MNHSDAYLIGLIHRLESERDALKAERDSLAKSVQQFVQWKNESEAEIDRLKTELDARKMKTNEAIMQCDLWKSKAEEAIELAKEMISYHVYEDGKPDYFNEKYEWEKRLADFDKTQGD